MRRKVLRTGAAAGAVVAVLALGACSNESNRAPMASPTPTATTGPVPAYPGATVTRHTDSTTLLSTDDPVSKVGAYYADALNRDGWKTVSKYVGDFTANIVAKRGHEGVTVQVTPVGSHTTILVSTFPVG